MVEKWAPLSHSHQGGEYEQEKCHSLSRIRITEVAALLRPLHRIPAESLAESMYHRFSWAVPIFPLPENLFFSSISGRTLRMSTPRLMILKLEVENFKSYGGVKEIGPFHKSFSSVVGPNGSGKSNVIDCMLFVFGKKSAKLRLNKVSGYKSCLSSVV